MLTCKEATRLSSKAMDAKLSGRERLGLLLHLAICALCRNHVKNMKKLRTKLRNMGQSNETLLPETVKLSPQSRERIKQAINKALGTRK